MSDKMKNHCERLAPGMSDCANQIKKGYCSFNNGGAVCLGRTYVAGANVEKGKQLATQYDAEKKLWSNLLKLQTAVA